ncbi:universal stress family protein [Mycolicibacterium hassiacum DSM 44199]|uniref:Universal stress family protein n=1 Tax=Mycolicibacterium hassiacum (strain DSM 44199 / CIP 105218 / JCM 12690 / 3849) TaxID=1122247 RepID=K5B8D9_MYCHD|nr:universal stress protein [Mycolicibacterium hassiacum]EKF23528.1 universal stress family protein [Mycolicibacterium hassiacum DSM 44199]MDA4084758.1 universal stress protein UspA [Mycolicibacterium hassiacum DSM 44199]VCT89978.1 Universal stress protein/MSMEI_3859 [Mycolicibacterium hassiacum DSM 44199]
MTEATDRFVAGSGPIVVGVDGTPASTSAARWAAAVADRFGAPLELINAGHSTRSALGEAAAAIRSAVLAAQQEAATGVLESVEHQIRADFPGLDVVTVRSDEPIDTLLIARSRDARLIVLGSDDLSAAAALVVGSTTLAVTGHSSCPVVAWRGAVREATSQPIVLGVDGERTGAAAFAAAFEFADRFGVELRAVHAWPAPHPDFLTPFQADWDGLEALQWSVLLNAVEPWTKRYPAVKVTNYLERGNPAEALLKHASDAQLVVVANRGRGAVASALLGSTSLNLLHHCRVPVLLGHTVSDRT